MTLTKDKAVLFLWVETDKKRSLKQKAARMGLSLAAMCRMVLLEWLEKQGDEAK